MRSLLMVSKSPKAHGFTLIELLIVVAIIAILAAIAVPNFLEAQTRSKISRTFADFRTIRTGLESYIIDNNQYPETDLGIVPLSQGYLSYYRITTPIAYLTSIPSSPWSEKYGTEGAANPKIASEINGYLYVRRLNQQGTDDDPNYLTDRRVYVFQGGLIPSAQLRRGEWLLKSVGPNNRDDRAAPPEGLGNLARLYDPTNGTVSDGDIVQFNDVNPYN